MDKQTQVVFVSEEKLSTYNKQFLTNDIQTDFLINTVIQFLRGKCLTRDRNVYIMRIMS